MSRRRPSPDDAVVGATVAPDLASEPLAPTDSLVLERGFGVEDADVVAPATLAEADLREVVFRNCKLDYANFRMAGLANVTFEDCVMVDVDFGGAKLSQVRFSGCELREAEFSNARMAAVDLRGSKLSVRGNATALRGSIVSPLQLMELAPVLAREAGIRVED